MIRSPIPKILVVSPDLSETSSWYRAAGPMSYLAKTGQVECTFCTPDMKLAWPMIMKHDILLILRPAFPSYAYLCRRAKDMGLKVWVDHDDNLLSLPYAHPEWNHFSSDQVRDSILECMRLADVITVTTKNLRGAFQNIKGITNDIRVIPNAIDDYLFPEPKAPRQAPNKIIAWRGGNSHAQDLAIVKDDVRKLVELGYRFVFFGMKPHVLEPVLPLGTWSHIEWNGEVDTFLRKLSDLNASFHMVPLENNDLNKAKSNIAWLEASWHGGSACVVSDIESDEWVDAMETEGIADTILTLTFGATEVVRSQRVIRDYFLLSAINNQRAKLVRELMEMK